MKERLYFSTYPFNCHLVMEELRKIVEEYGGRVRPQNIKLISNTNFPDMEPIEVRCGTYIRFVLDDYVYFFQCDSNIFYNAIYSKSKVLNDRYGKVNCHEVPDRAWKFDPLFDRNAAVSDLHDIAIYILNYLCKARETSSSYIEMKTIRVPNTYNDGFHEEKIPCGKQYEKIDW